MKRFFLTVFVLIVLVIIGFVGYVSYNYLEKKNSLQFTPIPSPQTDLTNVTTTDLFASSTIDIASWKSYENKELGYSLKYPSDLIMNRDEYSLILAFPKELYFSWPLKDNVKITVFASSTCASHSLLQEYGDSLQKPSNVTINGLTYLQTRVSGVGAGNIYNTISYDLEKNGICYSLVYYSHGSNGAGLYVDDPILVNKYDEEHTLNQKKVDDTIVGILSTLEIK